MIKPHYYKSYILVFSLTFDNCFYQGECKDIDFWAYSDVLSNVYELFEKYVDGMLYVKRDMLVNLENSYLL